MESPYDAALVLCDMKNTSVSRQDRADAAKAYVVGRLTETLQRIVAWTNREIAARDADRAQLVAAVEAYVERRESERAQLLAAVQALGGSMPPQPAMTDGKRSEDRPIPW